MEKCLSETIAEALVLSELECFMTKKANPGFTIIIK